MTPSRTHIGRCHRCDTVLRGDDVFIAYENDGWSARFAACPSCDAVVAPR